MPSCLVTGGAGFMGSHVASSLLASGHNVVVLDDLSGGFLDNVPEGAQFVNGSAVDFELLEELFEKHRFEYVFHLAAYAAEGLSHHIRRFNYENNVVASAGLISLSVRHEVRRFVFTSSIAVYGEAELPMREDMQMRPIDPYGIAKMAVELDLASAQRYFGLDYTIFRPHNVYGENQNTADRYRNVVGIFMNQIMNSEPMTVFGDGTQTRAFSYIGDVAPIIARSVDVAESSNEVFNVGADQPHSVLKLANVVAHAFGVEPKIEFLPERHEVQHAYSSHEKLRSVFGVTESTSLEMGIGAMTEWAMEVGPRASSPFSSIEVRRALPPSWDLEADRG
jgi:UDP-glucose 4-epimerase